MRQNQVVFKNKESFSRTTPQKTLRREFQDLGNILEHQTQAEPTLPRASRKSKLKTANTAAHTTFLRHGRLDETVQDVSAITFEKNHADRVPLHGRSAARTDQSTQALF